MAAKDKLKKERRKSRFAAMEAIRPRGGFPVPPRKAVSKARKASKKLPYPLPPYPGANPMQVYQWARFEWDRLGRWQNLTTPVIALVALLTWEREKGMQDARWYEIEHKDTKQMAAEMYMAFGRPAPRKRKLLGIIPLPGGKKR